MTRLDFSGKEFVYNHHLSVQYSELKPELAKSMVKEGEQAKLDGNLIIHGDNLRALKALLPRYEGRVNCIYIDPPYNTGNDGWCYNDNVNMPYLQEWFSNNPVNQEDMQRHEKWCCMMWPRLTLLKQLLADDGAIFISIDDNEIHHLRMMMDEIFGEENFKANFIWQHRKSSQNDIDISLSHNYIFCYSKDIEYSYINRLIGKEEIFSNPDNDERGDWVADPMDAPNIRENLTYVIINPNTKKEYLPPVGRHWRFTKEKYEDALIDNRIIFGKTGDSRPQYKRFKDEAMKRGRSVFTLWNDVETAVNGTQQIMNIFDGKKIFDTPKPVGLIKKIISLSTNKNDIILDSFAGSGTTAHATLELNKEDGGERKFILVECEDYANDVTAERVRRVIKGVPSAKDEVLKSGFGGDFTFCELSEPIDFDKLLEGENLPSSKEFAGLVWNLFSDKAFDEKKYDEKEFLIGSRDNELVFCFYKPDKKYLLSNESCLNTIRAEELSSSYPNKEIIVYAPACFVPNSILAKNKIKFAYLPFALFRLG